MTLDHGHEPLFEHDQHCDHFADALACQILEIAGLINTNNVVLHILRKAMVVVVLRTEARARAQSSIASTDPEFSGSPFPYFPPQRRVRRPRVPSDGRFEEMLKRQPYLPHFVAGGPHNPLGGRALYLGSSIYRIYGPE